MNIFYLNEWETVFIFLQLYLPREVSDVKSSFVKRKSTEDSNTLLHIPFVQHWEANAYWHSFNLTCSLMRSWCPKIMAAW